MRLGQLARKLEIKATDIVSLVEKELGETLENTPNLKLEDKHVELVNEHYKKPEPEPEVAVATEDAPETPEVEEAKEEPVSEEAPQETAPEESKEEEGSEEKTSEVESEEITVEEPSTELNIEDIDPATAETITAPKVELDGPTVVGKIDLPDPPGPQQIEVDGVMMDKDEYYRKKKEEREARKKKQQKRRFDSAQKDPSEGTKEKQVSLAEIKRQEEKEAAKAKKQKEADDAYHAQKRKEHYNKNFKQQPVKKKVKKKEEPVAQEEVTEPEIERKGFAKFWHWLVNAD